MLSLIVQFCKISCRSGTVICVSGELVLLCSKSSHMIQMLLSVEMWCDHLKEQRTLSVCLWVTEAAAGEECMCKGQCLMTALIKALIFTPHIITHSQDWMEWLTHVVSSLVRQTQNSGNGMWRAAFVLFKHDAQFRRLWFLLNQCIVVEIHLCFHHKLYDQLSQGHFF